MMVCGLERGCWRLEVMGRRRYAANSILFSGWAGECSCYRNIVSTRFTSQLKLKRASLDDYWSCLLGVSFHYHRSHLLVFALMIQCYLKPHRI
jgi:hypothetical protein